MSLNGWQAVGIVCGALIALGAVLRWAGRGIWTVFDVVKQAKEFFADALPDKKNKKPGLMDVVRDNSTTLEQAMERMGRIEQWQAEHDRLHGVQPAGPVPVRGRRPR